jgi:cell wall-associated NlpC family hydrolase
MKHWAESYLGLPWVAGENDCWAFARRVWRERFGFEVEPVPVDPDDPRAIRRAMGAAIGWQPVSEAAEGDAVLMGKGQRPCHVGVWVDVGRGAVLHAIERTGVVCTAPDRLPDLGYRIFGVYQRQ